jgi:hypothetical protein
MRRSRRLLARRAAPHAFSKSMLALCGDGSEGERGEHYDSTSGPSLHKDLRWLMH